MGPFVLDSGLLSAACAILGWESGKALCRITRYLLRRAIRASNFRLRSSGALRASQ